jgi:tetratricopeptide (TPR) repeat protein
VAIFAACLLALEVYSPAISGPFLFDDLYLPFLAPDFANAPFWVWIRGVRPVLMASFFLNHRLSGLEPYSYHLANWILHLLNSVLTWLIIRKLASGFEGWKRHAIPAFCGAVFLLHPLQTESVSYVASRSEALSIFFFYAAYTVFLYRRQAAIGLLDSVSVLTMFAAACLTKEHAVVLPALLLLTDYFYNPGFSLRGAVRNWKLYVPIALGGAFGVVWILGKLREADSAGFGMKDLLWHQYFFTQCRAIWVYLRMFVLPYGQNIDHDFPISRGILDHGAILALLGLVSLAAAAWIYRRRFPLASLGFFTFLILLAPTSSFVPIRDVLVERRVYLPMIGLLMVAAELVMRVQWPKTTTLAAMMGVLLVLAGLTWNRNQVWTSAVALWTDSASKAPEKVRPRFQLAYAHYADGRCDKAAAEYEAVARLQKPDYHLLLDWGVALDCANRPDAALGKFEEAAALERTAHIYSLIGMIHGKQGRNEQALEALDRAIKLNRRFALAYLNRGNVHMSAGRHELAVADYSRAVKFAPDNRVAAESLERAQQALRNRQVKTN